MDENLTVKQKVVASSFWLFGANIISRGVSLLSTLILARLLTPESFGVIGYGFLIVGAIGLLREMGFSSALIYQKREIDKSASSALIFIFFWSMILYLLIFFLAPIAATFFREPRLTLLLRALTITLVINSLASVPLSLLEKDINFKLRVIPDLVNLTTYGMVTVLFAFSGYDYWSFVIGIITGDLLQLITAMSLKPVKIRLKPDFSLLKELFRFGKNVMSLGVLNFAIRNIDDFFVGRMLGTISLGIYQFSYRIANIPATNITNIIGKVLYPGFTKIAHDKDRLREAFLKSLQYVSFLTIPITIYIIILTPVAIPIFLPKWHNAILPIQLIAYFGGIRSLSSGIGSLFLATGKPDSLVSISGIQLGFLVIFLYPVTRFWGLIGVCILVDISITISFILAFVKTVRMINHPFWKIINSILPGFVISILVRFLLIIPAFFSLEISNLLNLLLIGAGFPVLYLIISMIFSDIPVKFYKDLFNRD